MSTESPADRTPAAEPPPLRPRWLAVLPVLAAWLAYSGSLSGGFVFDDDTVLAPGRVIAAGDWWGAAFGTEGNLLANRPVTSLSLVLDPEIAGSQAIGHRVVNLVLHSLAALLLFAVARRTLRAANLRATMAPATATTAALALATVWACHPLGVDAVAYATQRSMLLVGLAFLAATYALLRLADTTTPWRWRVLFVVALVLGMGSKEEFLAAPVLMVLFDRAFLLPDWRSLRRRAGLHVAGCLSWVVLAVCVAMGPPNPTVGTDSFVAITPVQWLLTQTGVLLLYLRSVVWPVGLKGAHPWPIAQGIGDVWPSLLAVTALGIATVWQWRHRPWLGWLGALFFLLLGPTSSLLPLVPEPVADRRMYLPMLAVLAPLVVVTTRALAPRAAAAGRSFAGLAVWLAVAALLVPLTRQHAAKYRDQVAFWTAAHEQNELDGRDLPTAMILTSYAKICVAQGRAAEAVGLLERALRCDAYQDSTPLLLAECHWRLGDPAASERVLRTFLEREPGNTAALDNLATALLSQHEAARAAGTADASDPRLREALDCAQRAHTHSRRLSALVTIGVVLMRLERLDEAEGALTRALRSDPANDQARRALGQIHATKDRPQQVRDVLTPLLQRAPRDVDVRLRLAAAHRALGDPALALALVREALAIEPANAEALTALRELEAATGR